MKDMLNKQIYTDVKRTISSSEVDSLAVIQSISAEGFKSRWKAGKGTSTKATIARDRAALMNEVVQVAATTEYV